MELLTIRHLTRYRYAKAVAFGELQPIHGDHQIEQRLAVVFEFMHPVIGFGDSNSRRSAGDNF
jgi:hypothetical protein